MPIDPFMIVMLALIAVMIFFMFRNGKKRQAAMQELQSKMQPGAEVMLQSGIYATLEEIDEDANRATVRSGTSTFVVHRNAIAQVISDSDVEVAPAELAPDDDPEFGEHVAGVETTGETPANDEDENPKA